MGQVKSSPIREVLEASKTVRRVLSGRGSMDEVYEASKLVRGLFLSREISQELFDKFKKFYHNEFIIAQYMLLQQAGANYAFYNEEEDIMVFCLNGIKYDYPVGPISGFLLEHILPHTNDKSSLRFAIQEFFNNGDD